MFACAWAVQGGSSPADRNEFRAVVGLLVQGGAGIDNEDKDITAGCVNMTAAERVVVGAGSSAADVVAWLVEMGAAAPRKDAVSAARKKKKKKKTPDEEDSD
jgi:hypothetical protein